ncbi:ABC transporter ATP-binding protein [Acetobacter estunensis]|uniref:ABC transporter ATP-binding protein n=1 Tax=Acetobacter estunensis TaxID=104097 RepID=UPI001C2DF0EC|nr:ABC transporter ATP-binding protein [Acetobacter estunensis]MBV1837924.1 ABC transporter ATP-binding protein [Acetobacter estunensis]
MMSSVPQSPLLALQSIEKIYPNGFHAVHELNLSIGQGEFLTLLGPSGCGKTSTLRMIGGFELPSSGVILLNDHDVTTQPPNRRPVNTVFQDYALFPHMTIAENIAFGPTISGRKREEVRHEVSELLSTVGLNDKANLYPGQLSGGQRQRVALARALIQKPRLLLLDEPLGALDANMREQMQMELKNLQTQLGITFIMVTHDQEEALMLSDRIAVMNAGRLAQVGTPHELYNRPSTEFVASFLGITNMFVGEVKEKTEHGSLIDCSGQIFSLLTKVEQPVGSSLKMGIRPEKCFLGDRILAEADSLTFTARVKKSVFLGNMSRLHVETPFCPDFVVDIRDSRVSEGDITAISINPSNIMILPS